MAGRAWLFQSFWVPCSSFWLMIFPVHVFFFCCGGFFPDHPACSAVSVSGIHTRGQGCLRWDKALHLHPVPHGRGDNVIRIVIFPSWKNLYGFPAKRFLWIEIPISTAHYFFYISESSGHALAGEASSSHTRGCAWSAEEAACGGAVHAVCVAQ